MSVRRRQRAAAAALSRGYRGLARRKTNLLSLILPARWRARAHYPRGGVTDLTTGCQYYFHAHGDHPRERGHFHVFARAGDGPFAHVVAIRIDERGLPFALFTTCWNHRPAAEVRALLTGFAVRGAGPAPEVDRWITAMVRLFAPQISRLAAKRDAELARRRRRPPRGTILSELRISIDAQIARVELAARRVL